MTAIKTRAFTVIEPATVLASENPIVVTLGTHGNGSAGYTKRIVTFNNLNLITDGFNIKFSTNFGYAKTFYAKDFPNRSDYFLSKTLKDQIGTTITGNTLTQIANSLAESCQKDTVLNQNYYISYSGTSVILAAKQASTRFDFTVNAKTSAGVNSTGATYNVIDVSGDAYEGSLVSDYSLYVEPYFSNTSSSQFGDTLDTQYFNRITEVMLPFNPDNHHKFDVSTICKAYLSTPKPDFESSSYYNVEDYMRPFFFKYGESYPLVAGQNTKRKKEKGKTGFKWVLNAATDFSKVNDLRPYTGITFSGLILDTKFLTNSPTIKKSTKDGREQLYIILKKNAFNDIKLYGDITYWDGTQSSHILLDLNTGSGNFGGLYVLQTSFGILGLAAIESTSGKRIKTVGLSLRYTGGAYLYTEVKTYRFDYDKPLNRFGVSFLNKLGGYDTFDFQGLKTEEINREVTNYTQPLDIVSNGQLSEGTPYNATFDTKVTKKITVNSGFISKSEFDWLIELLSSNYIFSYDGYDNYLKLDSFKYSKNNQSNEYTIEVTFIQTIHENNISI